MESLQHSIVYISVIINYVQNPKGLNSCEVLILSFGAPVCLAAT